MKRDIESKSDESSIKPPKKTNNFKFVAGVLFFILAVVFGLGIKCPSNVQLIIIYSLMGVGFGLLLAKSAKQTTAKFTIANIGVVLRGAVALPFILIIINPIGKWKEDECAFKLKATSATVFVHNKKGKQEMRLWGKGSVIMDLGRENKPSLIDANGMAFFPNLRIGDSARLSIKYSEPYQPVYPDSVYVIENNEKIDLPVALQGIDKLNGMVLFNDAPLPEVTVKLMGETGYLLDTTNQTGDFSFSIPEEMQKSEYKIWLIKNRYKTKLVPAFPQTGEPLIIVMEAK